MFDFGSYSKDLKFFDETNKKVTGKMKDEFGGVIVNEFLRLNSKMYSIKKMIIKIVIIEKDYNDWKRLG